MGLIALGTVTGAALVGKWAWPFIFAPWLLRERSDYVIGWVMFVIALFIGGIIGGFIGWLISLPVSAYLPQRRSSNTFPLEEFNKEERTQLMPVGKVMIPMMYHVYVFVYLINDTLVKDEVRTTECVIDPQGENGPTVTIVTYELFQTWHALFATPHSSEVTFAISRKRNEM